jgi:hypothetical protein
LSFGYCLLVAACQPAYAQSYAKLLSQLVRIGKACDNASWLKRRALSLKRWVFAMFQLVNKRFASGCIVKIKDFAADCHGKSSTRHRAKLALLALHDGIAVITLISPMIKWANPAAAGKAAGGKQLAICRMFICHI